MLNWLRRILRADEETVDDIYEEFEDRIADLEQAIQDLERGFDVELADINDRIYPLLKKLNQRNAVRDSREKSEKIINSERRGIIRGSSFQS